MPNRVIKESIKRSPQIDALTWFEEVVFYRLLVTADDYGCMDARPVLLRNELFPTKENITKKSIEDAIQKLASVGLLVKYEVSGMPYLFFPTWEKHQRIRNQHRKFPEPPGDMDLTANCGQLTADCQSESESNPNPNPNPKGNTRARARFQPPTLEEVEAYCRERKNNVDAKRFFDYFSTANWTDAKGNPVRSWKQKVITWESYAQPAKKSVAEQGRQGVSDADVDLFMRQAKAWEAKHEEG